MHREEPTATVLGAPEDDGLSAMPPESEADLTELHSWLLGAVDIADALAKAKPSRELSMVKTKLDEAEMWLLKLANETEGQ